MLAERLGEVIDEATLAAVRKNSDLRRDGMSLLLRAVAAAIGPKGVSVEILKPDAVLRAERVSVGQMSDVFSGGQLLTAAIALYCTMAALRANDRASPSCGTRARSSWTTRSAAPTPPTCWSCSARWPTRWASS